MAVTLAVAKMAVTLAVALFFNGACISAPLVVRACRKGVM